MFFKRKVPDTTEENPEIVYTDGSSDKSLNKGRAGALLFPKGRKSEHIFKTGVTTSNLAIKEALTKYMSDSQAMNTTEGLIILSDSKSALEAL
ncbi:hypothetical protein TNCV_2654991 [Trichonephila clavipes]|nr:hypothetical protein TNCV_2654991 [Trichonephila clavipes]